MHRLFVSLRPPEPVRDALIDTMEGIEAARWQGDEQLHLTLRWVGEVDSDVANDVADALSSVRAPGFELALRGVGTFAKKGRATAIWADVAPSEGLAILQRRIEKACRAAGLAPETRKFVPHVTLARLNSSTGPLDHWLTRHGRLRAPIWPVRDFILYESHLGDSGSVYEPVMRYQIDI